MACEPEDRGSNFIDKKKRRQEARAQSMAGRN